MKCSVMAVCPEQRVLIEQMRKMTMLERKGVSLAETTTVLIRGSMFICNLPALVRTFQITN